MSLKHFHIFFISISVILSFGFAAWCFGMNSGGVENKFLGVCAAVAGVGLLVYERWFIRMRAEIES